MNGIERIRLAVRGEQTDRIPYSFWTHFPEIDLDPVKLAETTYDFYKTYNIDFIKNMSNGLFSVEDFGCECDFSEIAKGGVAKVTRNAVYEPEDWDKIESVNIEAGALGRELKSIYHLLDKVKGEAPVLITAFSPLTTAQKLSGGRLLEHLKTHPEKVHRALQVITESTKKFTAKAIQMGCAGVYFATQLASEELATEEMYRQYGIPFDLEILKATGTEAWFNVLHIHGDRIMFNLLKDYPVQAVSWHVWETAPSVEEFLSTTDNKCIVGGLKRFNVTKGLQHELSEEIAKMISITKGRRLILAPGCVIRAPFERRTLEFLKAEIERYGTIK